MGKNRCLNPFWCEQSLNKHLEYCSNHEAVIIEMPKKDDILKFKNYYKGEKVPFMIYADMESLLNPIQSCEPNPQSSYTKKYQKHQPISYNKYMGDKFNSSEPSKYIQYLDANNLYGAAMSKKLPTHGFKWMNDKELLVWRKIPCILEVDLEYPNELHDLHNDYSLAPERIMCKNKLEKLIPNLRNKEKYVLHYENLKHNDYPLAPERIMCKNKLEKLIPNLRNKEKYVLHYENLKQYLSLG